MNNPRNIAILNTFLGSALALACWLIFKDKYTFASGWVLWLLLLIPLLGLYEIFANTRKNPEVFLSSFSQFKNLGSWWSQYAVPLPFVLRAIGLTLLIVALARPQSELSWKNVTTEGIDVVMAMDFSASMLAKDFEPNRLEAAKEVAVNFIRERPNDRIGLVVYEGESFTQCPLTTDHNVLINLFKDVTTGMVEGGTAIGMGLATSVNRLKESDAKSKVVILLTDGVNNQGAVSPLSAAEIAESYGVRVYTIGVGSKGKALSPTYIYPNGQYKYDYVDVKIDEEVLQEIADLTGGDYFRATDENALAEIFEEIDRLEKTKINVTEHSQKSEEFFWFALVGAGLLLFEFLYKELIVNTLP
ncbi:MAG: VWA domain-containing protein [Cryomorphaceae bacterium]|nr:VWA domain-containing protein [Flavobacteriales bacterium]